MIFFSDSPCQHDTNASQWQLLSYPATCCAQRALLTNAHRTYSPVVEQGTACLENWRKSFEKLAAY
jgi:hypothetical protein